MRNDHTAVSASGHQTKYEISHRTWTTIWGHDSGIYAFLRYHLYGKHRMNAEMDAYFSMRQRVNRAIAILERQGFNIYEVNEDYYIISHPRDEVQTLRGGIETPALIIIAERLEPLLLHAELQRKATHEVLIKFDLLFSLN